MISTTLTEIRNHSPCRSGWEKLLNYLGKTQADDDPLPLLVILNNNGIDDALWCLRALPEYDREWRLFGVWCARRVQHLMTDKRSIAAVDVAERFAWGEASREELDSAWDDAWDAVRPGARDDARDDDASWISAQTTTRPSTTGSVAWGIAWTAARTVGARDSTEWVVARAEQESELRRILGG